MKRWHVKVSALGARQELSWIYSDARDELVGWIDGRRSVCYERTTGALPSTTKLSAMTGVRNVMFVAF